MKSLNSVAAMLAKGVRRGMAKFQTSGDRFSKVAAQRKVMGDRAPAFTLLNSL